MKDLTIDIGMRLIVILISSVIVSVIVTLFSLLHVSNSLTLLFSQDTYLYEVGSMNSMENGDKTHTYMY